MEVLKGGGIFEKKSTRPKNIKVDEGRFESLDKTMVRERTVNFGPNPQKQKMTTS